MTPERLQKLKPLVAAIARRIYHRCRRRFELEDLEQEAWVAALESEAKKGAEKFLPLENRMIDAMRRWSFGGRLHYEDVVSLADIIPAPDDSRQKADDHICVRQLAAAAQLNGSERVVLDALLEDRAQQDLAKQMGVHCSRVSQIRAVLIAKCQRATKSRVSQ
jgi:RNA polymerase sigma factor (sigma-70 family)